MAVLRKWQAVQVSRRCKTVCTGQRGSVWGGESRRPDRCCVQGPVWVTPRLGCMPAAREAGGAGSVWAHEGVRAWTQDRGGAARPRAGPRRHPGALRRVWGRARRCQRRPRPGVRVDAGQSPPVRRHVTWRSCPRSPDTTPARQEDLVRSGRVRRRVGEKQHARRGRRRSLGESTGGPAVPGVLRARE